VGTLTFSILLSYPRAEGVPRSPFFSALQRVFEQLMDWLTFSALLIATTMVVALAMMGTCFT
jgi:hypothetical protein